MARKIVCRVCDSERFRKVVVTLPSGQDRVTDFDYCLRCSTVFYRPGEREALPTELPAGSLSNVTNFTWHISPAVCAAIAKSFADPNTVKGQMQSAHYQHPTFGRLLLIFKAIEVRGTDEEGMKWHLEEARRLTE